MHSNFEDTPTLSWTVGAVLATASFEAYNELSKQGTPERQCDANIFYVDRWVGLPTH
jgi:hypothetical protein